MEINEVPRDPPITVLMASVDDGPGSVRLFTRGRDSVRVEVVARTGGVRLLVKGPGAKRASYDFDDVTELARHQSEVEQQLAAIGFELERFVTERRRWPR
jgi:hypothetical protein